MKTILELFEAIDRKITKYHGDHIAQIGKIKPEDFKVKNKFSVIGKNDEKYDVTHTTSKTPNKQPDNKWYNPYSLEHIFIHHNGKHVGTVVADRQKDSLKIVDAGMTREHQGNRVVTKVHKHLIDGGENLIPSDHQSIGGSKIWKELNRK